MSTSTTPQWDNYWSTQPYYVNTCCCNHNNNSELLETIDKLIKLIEKLIENKGDNNA